MARKPILYNFSAEFQPFNLQLGVKDISNQLITDTEIIIESAGIRHRTKTDLNGCVSGVAQPGVVSTLCVNRRGYIPLAQKFILVNQAQLRDPNKNLFLFLYDSDGEPVSDGQVIVHSFQQSISTLSNPVGLIETDYIPGIENILSFRKGGFSPIDEIIPAFSKTSCGNAGYRAVPVFTLERVDAFVLLDPGPAIVNTPTTIQVEARRANGDLITDLETDVTVKTTGNALLANNGRVDISQGVGQITILNFQQETVTLTLEDTEGTGLDVSSSLDLTFS